MVVFDQVLHSSLSPTSSFTSGWWYRDRPPREAVPPHQPLPSKTAAHRARGEEGPAFGSPSVRWGDSPLSEVCFLGSGALVRRPVKSMLTVWRPSLEVYSLRITLITTPWISTSPSTMMGSMLELAGCRRMCPFSA